jgi:hypothetical protein
LDVKSVDAAFLRAQSPLRLALVSQPEGAPVVLVGTHTVDGRVHGAVTVRNVSTRVITALTLVLTLGDPHQRTALRRTDSVSAAIAPDATVDVPLPGITAAAVAQVLPAVAQATVELAIARVTFADGSRWRLRSLAAWLSRPGAPITAQCLDSHNVLVPIGGTVLDAAVTKQCGADGLLVAVTGGVQ